MKRLEATNTFLEGMVMDFNPLTTPNNVVTNCLNGTLITFNGNEYVLLNDMGNGRVETAYLPEGYVPLGTAELGGIIYIVSYNPLNSKCQIGSFPSPERNVTKDEVLNSEELITISEEDFKNGECIISPLVKKRLGDFILHPGDKFIVCGNPIASNIGLISHYVGNEFNKRYITFKLATIDNNGRIIYLDDLKKYPIEGTTYSTHIKEGNANSILSTDIDQYRKIIGSDYNVFSSKIAGNLYVIGLLEVIDSINSITWEVLDILDPIDKGEGEGGSNEGNEGEGNEGDNGEGGNEGNNREYNVSLSSESDSKLYKIRFTVETFSERDNIVEGIKQFHDGNSMDVIPNSDRTNNFSYIINYIADKETRTSVEIIPWMSFGLLCYLKLKVALDFSYIGSNLIVNNIWQYLKQSESIYIKFDINNYFINKVIDGIKLSFKEMGGLEDNIYEYELPARKSYSGIHSIIIPFKLDTIKANSLYLVDIKLNLSGKYTTLVTHYLYTNGVFNQYFNSNDEDKENFDNVKLPLIPFIKLENAFIDLSYTNELKEGSSLSSHISSGDHIRGITQYTAKGSKVLNIKSTFEDTFEDTFSLVENTVSIKLAENNSPTSIKDTKIVNIEGNEVIDSEYIKEVTSLDKNNEKLDILLKEEEENKYVLQYDIKLSSPISAVSTSRLVTVQKYFSPVLYTLDDFLKYCLLADLKELEDNSIEIENISLDSTLPALGMSAGGRDNQGGGGLTFVAGTANVTINRNPSDDVEVGLLISGSADSLFSGAGISGISRFPNELLSRIISASRGFCGMVPVFLVNAGTSYIMYNLKYYLFQGSGNRDKVDNKKVEWFETSNQNCGGFTSALLFVRLRDSDEYIPINHFFILAYEESERQRLEYPRIKLYYSLLSQLYAQRPFDDTVNVYTVGKFSYLNKKVLYLNTLHTTVTYTNESLLFNNKKITDLFKGKTLPECAKIDFTSTEGTISFDSKLEYTFDIDNKYVDTYLEYYHSLSIPTYVDSNGSSHIQAPANPVSSGIYIADNGILKQIQSSFIELPLVTLSLSPERDYSTISTVKSTTEKITYRNLDMLVYDIRNDFICANRSKVNSSLALYWGCHKPNYNNPTYICNKFLDGTCTIETLIKNNG